MNRICSIVDRTCLALGKCPLIGHRYETWPPHCFCPGPSRKKISAQSAYSSSFSSRFKRCCSQTAAFRALAPQASHGHVQWGVSQSSATKALLPFAVSPINPLLYLRSLRLGALPIMGKSALRSSLHASVSESRTVQIGGNKLQRSRAALKSKRSQPSSLDKLCGFVLHQLWGCAVARGPTWLLPRTSIMA